MLTYLASRDEKLIIAVLETLEAILVDSSENIIVFEEMCGVQLVCSVLKQMKHFEAITHKCIELFTVYLHQETNYPDYNANRQVVSKRLLLIEYLGRDFVEMLEVTFI